MQIREYGKLDAPRLLLLGQGAEPDAVSDVLGDRFHTILPVLPKRMCGARCAQQIAAFLNDRYGGRVYAIVSTSTAWPVARRLIGAIASEKMVLGARQDDPRALVAEMVGRS